MAADLSYSFDNKREEVFSPTTLEAIRRLNRTVHGTGTALEGNLCYFHHAEDYVDLPPDPKRAPKRRNLLRAIRGKKLVLEIGFNAGHSALLALAAEPGLRYVGVDICRHSYTKPCGEVLREIFGDRFELIAGDSRTVLPRLYEKRPQLAPDLFHVDGGHGVETCIADIENSIRIARGRKGVHVLVDDTAAQKIRDVVNRFINTGYFITETYGGEWEGRQNYCAALVRSD